jgi:hypothetical protein
MGLWGKVLTGPTPPAASRSQESRAHQESEAQQSIARLLSTCEEALGSFGETSSGFDRARRQAVGPPPSQLTLKTFDFALTSVRSPLP